MKMERNYFPIVVLICFAKVRFHLICCCLDYKTAIGLQSGWATNWILAGSLNVAEVQRFILDKLSTSFAGTGCAIAEGQLSGFYCASSLW